MSIVITALTQVSNLLVTLNSSVNFIIYIIYGEKFQRLFLLIFCKRHQRHDQMLRRFTTSTFHATRVELAPSHSQSHNGYSRPSRSRARVCTFGIKCKNPKLSKNSNFLIKFPFWLSRFSQNSHFLKVSFFTKITFRKSHFSQNSLFQSLTFQ